MFNYWLFDKRYKLVLIMNFLKICLRKVESEEKICFDVNVSKRFFMCECIEMVCGVKRISCWVKWMFLKIFRCINS